MLTVSPDRLLTQQQFVYFFQSKQVIDVFIIELARPDDPEYVLGLRTIVSENVLFLATRRGELEPRQWVRLDAVANFLRRECAYSGTVRLVIGPTPLAPVGRKQKPGKGRG